jgi:hypothetical protein
MTNQGSVKILAVTVSTDEAAAALCELIDETDNAIISRRIASERDRAMRPGRLAQGGRLKIE